jgi:hypothetical protein
MSAIDADTQEEEIGRWAAGPTPTAPVADAARCFDAAFAVLGGRFRNVKHALKHEDFAGADHPLTSELLENMRENQEAVTSAIEEEEERVAKAMAEATASTSDAERRSDLVWLEEQFTLLLCVATADAITMAEHERLRYGWIFQLGEMEDRRYYAYKFQYSVYTDLLDTVRPRARLWAYLALTLTLALASMTRRLAASSWEGQTYTTWPSRSLGVTRPTQFATFARCVSGVRARVRVTVGIKARVSVRPSVRPSVCP